MSSSETLPKGTVKDRKTGEPRIDRRTREYRSKLVIKETPTNGLTFDSLQEKLPELNMGGNSKPKPPPKKEEVEEEQEEEEEVEEEKEKPKKKSTPPRNEKAPVKIKRVGVKEIEVLPDPDIETHTGWEPVIVKHPQGDRRMFLPVDVVVQKDPMDYDLFEEVIGIGKFAREATPAPSASIPSGQQQGGTQQLTPQQRFEAWTSPMTIANNQALNNTNNQGNNQGGKQPKTVEFDEYNL
jgi:hypothetical protein